MNINVCVSPLLQYALQLYDLNIRYRILVDHSLTYTARKVTDEHERIVQFATSRNKDLANDLLIDHYTRAGEYLAEQLNLLSS